MEIVDNRRSMNIKYGIMQALYWMSFCSTYLYAAYYLTEKGVKSSLIGILLASANILAAVLQPLTASFLSKCNKCSLKQALSIMAFINVAIAVLITVSASVVWTASLGIVLMVMISLNMHSFVNSFALEYSTKEVEINFSIGRAIGSLGFAAASLYMGYITKAYGPNSVVLVSLLLHALFILSIFSFGRQNINKQNLHKQNIHKQMSDSKDLDNIFIRYKGFFGVFLGAVCLFIGYNMVINFLILITENLGGSSKQMGIALALAAFLEVPGMLLYNLLSKKMSSTVLLKISSFFFTVKVLGVLLAGSIPTLYAAHTAQFLSFALFVPASVYYVDKLMHKKHRIKGQAYITTAITLGGMFGSFAGGMIIEYFNVYTMLAAAASISAAGTILVTLSAKLNSNENIVGGSYEDTLKQ